jgi:hypothetical protein
MKGRRAVLLALNSSEAASSRNFCCLCTRKGRYSSSDPLTPPSFRVAPLRLAAALLGGGGGREEAACGGARSEAAATGRGPVGPLRWALPRRRAPTRYARILLPCQIDHPEH